MADGYKEAPLDRYEEGALIEPLRERRKAVISEGADHTAESELLLRIVRAPPRKAGGRDGARP